MRPISCLAVWPLVACYAMALSSDQSSPGNVNTLEGAISHVKLTSGAEAFGGATIEDAVAMLRRRVDFPICLELKEFSREADGLTLGEAIDQLNALKAQHPLEALDQSRLQRYEELAGKESASTLIGFKEKTFTLIEDNITVSALLDRLTTLDTGYIWRNHGTRDAPIVVIQPREKSALDWAVPPICGAAQDSTFANLYGPEGRLTALFRAHSIARLEFHERDPLPDIQLSLCREHLTARAVLNLTITSAGNDLSWSLAGIKGLRWLSFQ